MGAYWFSAFVVATGCGCPAWHRVTMGASWFSAFVVATGCGCPAWHSATKLVFRGRNPGHRVAAGVRL